MNIINPPHEIVAKELPIKIPSLVWEDMQNMKKAMEDGKFYPYKDNLGTTKYLMTAFAIAHPQVSYHPYRFFVMGGEKYNVSVIINPKIIKKSGYCHATEACLSFPTSGKTKVAHPRYKRITVQFEDENRKTHVENIEGFDAQIFQHEIEHLDGENIFGYKSHLQE